MNVTSSPSRRGGFLSRLARWFRNMPAERPGLAWKVLAGTVMVGILPLLVAAIVIPRTMQSAFAEISRDYLGQVAQHIASTIEMEMRRHVDATTAVSKIGALRATIRLRNQGTLAPAAIEAANEQLVSLVQSRSLEHQGLFLCDRDGTVFAGALRSGDVGPYTHIDIRARAYFQQARHTGTTVVSELIRSKVQDVPIVVIAVPVHDERGVFEGLIGLSVEISHLSSFIVQQTPRLIGTPFAIDRQGMIFAHHDSNQTFRAPLSHMPGMEILASRMVRGESGVESYRLPDRTEKMAAFAPVPLTGWSVAVSMRASQFVAASRGIQTVIVVLVLAFALVGLLVAAALSLSFEQIRQALSDVRTSNHRFKLFASAVGDVIWDLDLASGRFSLNDDQNGFLQLADLTGSSFDALTAFIPKAERAIFEQGIESCRHTGQWTGEHHILRKDGSLRYALHRVLLIKNSRGEPDHLVGRLTDITERRDTEEKLARQAALLDQTRDGIMVLDLDHTIKYWNKGAGALYGWTAEEALGRRQDELLATEIELPAELVVEKGEWFGTLKKKTRAGAVLTLDCRWTLLRDERGEPQAILTLDTDITERKQMEAKFLRAQRLESIGTLAGGIAHDFNNLLSPIVMGVELLKRTTQGAEAKRIMGSIEESSHRATSLVKQILSFARGEAGARVSVLLAYVIREVESIALRTFPRNIGVRLNIAKDLWLVHADPTQMNQVLMNLCVNARDAMPQGGRLTVSARNVEVDDYIVTTNRGAVAGPHVLLEVSDTGTGISAANLERIFEPFFTTKELGHGTGLGLSTVIGIARDHGGFVNVYSEEGRGSVFKVYLPAMGGPAVTPNPAVENPGLDLGHGELVLLVDDDAPALSVTKHVLESSGYRVVTAADGANAFSIYHSHRARISVVVTDMMMPVMDGPALVEAIRRVDPHMCFVGASGLGDNYNQIKATEMNLHHFLCKPYTTAALLMAIRASMTERLKRFGSSHREEDSGSASSPPSDAVPYAASRP